MIDYKFNFDENMHNPRDGISREEKIDFIKKLAKQSDKLTLNSKNIILLCDFALKGIIWERFIKNVECPEYLEDTYQCTINEMRNK